MSVRVFSSEPPSERSPEELKMTQQEIEEFAKLIARLIRESAEVRQACSVSEQVRQLGHRG
jgi:hypothetical protein